MRYEFHSHTFLSDGELHPIEHVRRAAAAGHNAVAITDHVGVHDAARVLPTLLKECEAATKAMRGIRALAGVEITHVPPSLIAEAAKNARAAGAQVVVVHGETVNEPVAGRTNAAAVACRDVDILGHPGFLAEKDLRTALDNGIYVEITAKLPHAVTNGHLARLIEKHDAPFLVNGDVHNPEQFVTEERARAVALGAGLPKELAERGLRQHPQALLKRRGA